jgi:hypothetical protein
VMFSGGLDSTYCLYHYLTKTDLNVRAHHISLRYNLEPRWIQEDQACLDIVNYCKNNYRDFDYTKSRFDWFDLSMPGWDADLCTLVGARVCLNTTGKSFVVSGAVMEDMDSLRTRQRFEDGVRQKLWDACRLSLDYSKRKEVKSEIQFPLLDMKLES